MSVQELIASLKSIVGTGAFFGFLIYLTGRIFRYLEIRVAARTGNEILESTKKRTLRFFRSKTALPPLVAVSRQAPKAAPPPQPEPERQERLATANRRPLDFSWRKRR